jgi:hypothetical protein
MKTLFKPGDVIICKQTNMRYIVAERIRTSHGNLRLINKNGNINTTWWYSTDDLPPGYEMEQCMTLPYRIEQQWSAPKAVIDTPRGAHGPAVMAGWSSDGNLVISFDTPDALEQVGHTLLAVAQDARKDS